MTAHEVESILQDTLSKIGVSVDDAAVACLEIASFLPPIGEMEISLIKNNPNISRFRKWRLIRNIRRQRADGRKER